MIKRMQAVMALGAIPQFGPARIRKFLAALEEQNTSLEFLMEFDRQDLLEMDFSADQADAFFGADTLEMAEGMVDNEISLIVSTDADAPKQFSSVRLNPWFFVRGDQSILSLESIGFSGSRDASPEAARITSEIATSAATEGWCVISGGARGIDTTAHKSAIEAGGATVVVLPQGIGTWRLPDELDSTNTLVMSEFMPLDDWGSFRAMQRNKSIIHLSDRLVIPQSGERGGTWNAGEYALKHEHPTWVIDLGDGFPGNSALIKKGGLPLVWNVDSSTLEELSVPAASATPAQQTLF